MAELSIMGPFEGPGEKRTAEHLAEALPESWHVIPNRKLPNSTTDDIDIWIVGNNRVFIVEEKSWGPRVIVGGHLWSVVKDNGQKDDRPNAFNSVSLKAKKAATWLKSTMPELQKTPSLLTVPAVVFSHPRVDVLERPGYQIPDNIFTLSDAENFLLFLDSEDSGPAFKANRKSIISTILDLDSPDKELTRIGDYEVTGEMEARSGLRIFEAEHATTGEAAILKCFDDAYWSRINSGADIYIDRELLVLNALAELNRSWRYHPKFYFERKGWSVVPVIKPKGVVSLQEMTDQPERDFYRSHALEICADAFRALAEVHDESVAHKALTPSRIWLGRGLRVIFSDFYLSHMDGNESVMLLEDDESSLPFRDKEARLSLEFADTKSDVYALAFSIASWLTGGTKGENHTIVDELLLRVNEPVFQLLVQALDDDREIRPSARILADGFNAQLNALRQPVPPQLPKSTVLDVGQTFAERFEILEKLGRGGVATTWKVRDLESDGEIKVLKQLHNERFFELARSEYANAFKLDHPGCSKTREIVEKPAPGFLVSEYVPGVTLLDRAKDVNFGATEARFVARSALEILSYIHKQGLVHGDVSPRNIIVDENMRTTLIDFGLLSSVGAIQQAGTRATMSPEAISGQPQTAQSDIYSFGATMILALLGRTPYDGAAEDVSSRNFEVKPLTDVEITQWGEEGSLMLEVFLRAAEPDLEVRYKEVSEILAELDRAIPLPVDKLPKLGSIRQTNPIVDSLRSLYTRSKHGSKNALGITSDFARSTYVKTKLDTVLLKDVVDGLLDVVFLTGNPGDGKTSFLQILEEHLVELGAEGHSDTSGWKYTLSGRTFHAIFDASEAYGELSNDELVSSALVPVSGGNYTALLAVNDGRLRQFFIENEDRFPDFADEVEAFFGGKAPSLARFAIVDLKMRALAGLDTAGLALELMDNVSNPELWSVCGDCIAKFQCPAFKNASYLRDGARESVNKLVLTSHLKRSKRATIRQFRSTLGWLITGDMSCEEVHLNVESNQDPSSSIGEFGNLIFGGHSEDALIQEWSQMDPGRLLSPVTSRLLATESAGTNNTHSRVTYEKYMRDLFLGIEGEFSKDTNSVVPRSDADFYKYLGEYIQILRDPSNIQNRKRLLLGISKLIGAFGYEGSDLAISQDSAKSAWAVLKPINEEEITLETNYFESSYIEFSPDLLILKHVSGAQLSITLDTAEVLLRVADGQVYSSQGANSITYEIENFGRKLLRQVSEKLIIVEPSGVSNQVVISNNKLRLVQDSQILEKGPHVI